MIELTPIDACWMAGDLSYLLHEGQVLFRDTWRQSTKRKFVVCCSRRFGKSYWLLVEAVELALRLPGAQIRYGAPTQKMVRTIVEPLLKADVLSDCPPSLRPKPRRNEGVWVFPNGSEIHIAGCDGGGAERLRGPSTHLAIVDEAGFVDDLRYVIRDVLMPQTLTVDGKILIVSTPSRTPAHPFADYCSDAEAEGAYIHRTIWEAPHISENQIYEYMAESGGETSTTWRREYLAEHVVDEEMAVVPEFSRHEAQVVGEPGFVPLYRDRYVAADLGYQDLTVVVFAYYHWDLGKLIVEDEVVLKHTTSDLIDEAIEKKERELWREWSPYRRVVDAPLQVVADLRKVRGRSWMMARKDHEDAALNALRTAISRHQVLINPKCRAVISHLRHAVWNNTKTSYARTDGYGHYDGVDAMKYLVRHCDKHRNPYPAMMGVSKQRDWIRGQAKPVSATGGAVLGLVRDSRKCHD